MKRAASSFNVTVEQSKRLQTKKTRHDDAVKDDYRQQHVNCARARLLLRLSERSVPLRLHGLEKEYNALYKLLSQTVEKGESNSCLLIGNRGTGKTALVQRALEDLDQQYNSNKSEQQFCVVRLNGQTESTDRLALSEIARQLFAKKQQQQQQQEAGPQDKTFTSFAESFEYLLSLLKSGDKTTLPVIFILEEFDLFVQQPKQALLYNLFDAAQSAQTPMAVVGLTCRFDAFNSLEKRVKSRFSHRQIYLYPPAKLSDFVHIARESLRLSVTDSDPPGYKDYVAKFNENVEALFQNANINAIVRRIFELSKDLRMFFKICFEPVSRLNPEEPYLQAEYFNHASDAQRSDAKTELLKGVSLLELILIISMKKLLEKEITTFNFEMVYDEYKSFMSNLQLNGRGFGMKLYKRPVALKAFENLQNFELVCPVEDIAKCPKEYRMNKLMLEIAQVTEIVLKYKDCPTAVKAWGVSSKN